MNVLKRIFSSNPFHFALGVGAGLVGLYFLSKTEENKKFEKMLNDLEETIKVLEMKKLAAVENTESEQSAKAS